MKVEVSSKNGVKGELHDLILSNLWELEDTLEFSYIGDSQDVRRQVSYLNRLAKDEGNESENGRALFSVSIDKVNQIATVTKNFSKTLKKQK